MSVYRCNQVNGLFKFEFLPSHRQLLMPIIRQLIPVSEKASKFEILIKNVQNLIKIIISVTFDYKTYKIIIY